MRRSESTLIHRMTPPPLPGPPPPLAEALQAALDEVASIFDDLPPPCPACDGPGELLGHLGTLAHYRCRHCGWGWSS